jgi:hypothetical protein
LKFRGLFPTLEPRKGRKENAMARKLLIAPLLALGLATASAAADPPRAPAPPEASIPFANNGGIRDWRDDGKQALYIQDRYFRWYRVTLMTPSFDLPTALAIGFDTGPGDRFDRFSWIVVDGQRYAVQSLVRIEGKPPSRKARHSRT